MSQRDDLCFHCGLAAKPDKKGIQNHYYKVEHGLKRLTGHVYNFNNHKEDEVFSKDT